jgi:hypothetical protein
VNGSRVNRERLIFAPQNLCRSYRILIIIILRTAEFLDFVHHPVI